MRLAWHVAKSMRMRRNTIKANKRRAAKPPLEVASVTLVLPDEVLRRVQQGYTARITWGQQP